MILLLNKLSWSGLGLLNYVFYHSSEFLIIFPYLKREKKYSKLEIKLKKKGLGSAHGSEESGHFV